MACARSIDRIMQNAWRVPQMKELPAQQAAQSTFYAQNIFRGLPPSPNQVTISFQVLGPWWESHVIQAYVDSSFRLTSPPDS